MQQLQTTTNGYGPNHADAPCSGSAPSCLRVAHALHLARNRPPARRAVSRLSGPPPDPQDPPPAARQRRRRRPAACACSPAGRWCRRRPASGDARSTRRRPATFGSSPALSGTFQLHRADETARGKLQRPGPEGRGAPRTGRPLRSSAGRGRAPCSRRPLIRHALHLGSGRYGSRSDLSVSRARALEPPPRAGRCGPISLPVAERLAPHGRRSAAAAAAAGPASAKRFPWGVMKFFC